MIERLIFTALQSGMADFQQNPTHLTRYFTRLGLSASETQSIQTFFAANPPTIVHNYPKTQESTFPLFCIILQDEQDIRQVLDDDGGIVDISESQALLDPELDHAIIRTSIYKFEYAVLIMTAQPDLTLYYYQMAKYFLTKIKTFLKQQGILDFAMSGSDIAPDARYLPEYLFVRRLGIVGMVEYAIFEEQLNSGNIIRTINQVFLQTDNPANLPGAAGVSTYNSGIGNQ